MVIIAVVGAGNMGVKIAGEFASHGHRVKMFDSCLATLNKVQNILESDRKSLCADGLLPQKHFLGQVYCLSHLEETVRDADFIFEVVVEDLEVKKDVFERISHCCKNDAVMASNSLHLDINQVNERALFKQRTLGVRFLYPVYYIPEIEISPAKLTDNDVIEKVRKLIERMGKTLFFRSGNQPLILTEKQREDRKEARRKEIQLLSEMGTHSSHSVLSLSHGGINDVPKFHVEAETTSDVDRDCAICMDRVRDCLLIPCHHMVTCYQCGEILLNRHDACPICRKDIQKAVKVYHT